MQSDPHQLPTFDDTTLTSSTDPIFYLPPLLSSLPEGYSHPTEAIAPYNTLHTDSRLPEIDPLSLALHRSLHGFSPITPEYAVTPYDKAFNWDKIRLPEEAAGEWYCVVFRSKRTAGSDSGPLYGADKLAHEEAVQSGGLILYWYGVPHPTTGLNLATCIWQSRTHAMAATTSPHHTEAMRLAAVSYDRYELQRYRLIKRAGEPGVHIEPYEKENAD